MTKLEICREKRKTEVLPGPGNELSSSPFSVLSVIPMPNLCPAPTGSGDDSRLGGLYRMWMDAVGDRCTPHCDPFFFVLPPLILMIGWGGGRNEGVCANHSQKKALALVIPHFTPGTRGYVGVFCRVSCRDGEAGQERNTCDWLYCLSHTPELRAAVFTRWRTTNPA